MDARVSGYDVSGWFQLEPDDHASPTVALSWTQLHTSTADPALPDDLIDVSVAGSIVRPLEDDWSMRLTAGAGFAGDNAFSDGSGFYGLARVSARHQLGPERGYILLVDYNGNRSVFPDIPLPGFVYYDRLNEQVRYALGLPSRITWTPDSQTTLRASATPGGFGASVEHVLAEGLTIFALYDSRVRAFHLDRMSNDRRFFFEQSRVEAGIDWRNPGGVLQGVEVRAAVGYAFDQAFTRGWDSRDDDTVRDLTDEPYASVGVTCRF